MAILRVDSFENVRIDVSDFGRTTKTREGFLRTVAIVARTGIQEYYNLDGTVRLELRHPDEVFAKDAVDSLKMLPMTNLHPEAGTVTAENAKKYQVGYTGETVQPNGRYIAIPLTITDAEAIKAIEDGRRELSVGYTVDLIEESGIYDGKPYTHKQTNIRGNHIALVDKARAGAEARIHIDEQQEREDDLAESQTNDKKHFMSKTNIAKVNFDGAEYEAPVEVVKALDEAKARADNAESMRADAEAKLDALQARIDSAEVEKAEILKRLDEANDPQRIDSAINERLSLIERARIIASNLDFTGKSKRQVMEAAVIAKHDGLDLSQKSDSYVEARFDALIELAQSNNFASQRAVSVAASINCDHGLCSKEDAENAIKNMYKKNKDNK